MLLLLASATALGLGCRPGTEELWAEHCARCHGPDGRGEPSQLAFYPQVDLTRSELIADNAQGPVYQRIAFGWGAMPGFDHKLKHTDLERLARFSIELGQAGRDAEDSRPKGD